MSLAHHFITGDCRQVMPTMPANLFDSIITDPPYALKFMGRGGDCTFVAFQPETWRQALRVTKPGGYLLAFGGTRTFHRLACAIEDAGWQIKDTILSLYDAEPMAQAFLDSLSAEQRDLLDKAFPADSLLAWVHAQGFPKGKGTLKPAWEPVLLAAKPGLKVLPLGIEETRVPVGESTRPCIEKRPNGIPGHSLRGSLDASLNGSRANGTTTLGRWPANVVLDDSEQVAEAFAAFGERASHDTKDDGAFYDHNRVGGVGAFSHGNSRQKRPPGRGDTGTAARYFMCCPADTTTGVENCEYLWHHEATDSSQEFNSCCKNACLAVANSMLAYMTFSEGSADSVVETADANTCENEAKRTPGGCRQKTVDGIAAGEKRGTEKSIGRSKAGGSGKWPTDQSPTAATFTTGIETTRTTTCPTCNCSLLLSTTPCISESGKIIGYSLTARKSGDASGATSTSPLKNSSDGKPALFKATAKPVSGKNSDSGGNETERSTTPTCESIASVNSARFFYTAKASRSERGQDNRHVTVKPLSLMRWLVRLVTTPGGLVLDPFSGSGTTLLACAHEGRSGIGIELYPTNNVIAQKRLANLDTTKGES